jgi:hypothetical protein
VIGIGLVAVLVVATGCSTQQPRAVPVPTFPAGAAVAGVSAAPNDPGIPDDCERIMPTGDLIAVLGLPLGSVAARTTVGVPAPSVGRIERVTCRYSGTQGRVRGVTLLELNAGRYVDGGAAGRHWRVNADAESGPKRDVRIGTAPAVLVEGRGEALLTVTYADVAVTLALPPGAPTAPGRSPADTLADLAVRVLADVVAQSVQPITAG